VTARVRRYARPRIRQRTARGRRLWVYELRCRCGWAQLIGGTKAIALAVADAHWHDTHRRRSA